MEHNTEEPGLPGAHDPAQASQADYARQGVSQPAEQHQATGEPRVDEALQSLDELGSLPVSAHPGVFEQVHASLQEVLGELDLDPGPVAGAQQRPSG
jgi:hypothetical protein